MGEVRFGDVADRWMATKVHLRPSTRTLYDWLLTKHIRPTFGDQPIGSITTLDLQMWIADRHANSRLGPNSVAKAYKIIRAVMESAVDAGLILRSPCRVKGAATEHLPEMRAATTEEVASLAHAAGPRWQALILLAAYSGLRWGELAGLRRVDVDTLHRTVRVEHQLSEVNGHLAFSAPKTSAGVRTITLPQFIVDVLVDHLARWSAPNPDGLVFVMPEGTPLRRENFRKRVWLPACGASGLYGLRFHDLRHTGATLAAASGAPLRAVMHRLGHASAAAAIRYQHRVAGQDEAIADYLDRIGRSAVPSPSAEVRRLTS
jgi:integrase